ncbi:type I-E CRISPR-associated endoribonuclease Cas2 [Arthrobacter sp. MYb227]|uniref:type I-E CRISPR-associated endoribonuclease Cas2e n=1 Tax=Arthrobacter sp. MYb227 TaxID=1848601 RepID=UPI000CFB8F1C|nr:type I-E CRISPR-associated endoribonuclease Cas2e [Arthrobacter sp. MYb227]PQZ94890.1 type I-E CRISPR-associated endoribonuclease Cas2 [Arthrobacter sp. MYb227]
MTVLVLSSCPVGLRGFLTRWFLEISAGVFVGVVSARIRDEIWAEVKLLCKDGRAILIFTARNEQRMKFRVHRHHWQVKDFDGISLMARPREPKPESISIVATTTPALESDKASGSTGIRPGWSNMSKYRRGR